MNLRISAILACALSACAAQSLDAGSVDKNETTGATHSAAVPQCENALFESLETAATEGAADVAMIDFGDCLAAANDTFLQGASEALTDAVTEFRRVSKETCEFSPALAGPAYLDSYRARAVIAQCATGSESGLADLIAVYGYDGRIDEIPANEVAFSQCYDLLRTDYDEAVPCMQNAADRRISQKLVDVPPTVADFTAAKTSFEAAYPAYAALCAELSSDDEAQANCQVGAIEQLVENAKLLTETDEIAYFLTLSPSHYVHEDLGVWVVGAQGPKHFAELEDVFAADGFAWLEEASNIEECIFLNEGTEWLCDEQRYTVEGCLMDAREEGSIAISELLDEHGDIDSADATDEASTTTLTLTSAGVELTLGFIDEEPYLLAIIDTTAAYCQ